MGRRRPHNQRREELLENIAVVAEEEPEELRRVVGHQIELEAVVVRGPLDRLRSRHEPHDVGRREEMDAAEIEIGIGGGEAVEVGPADGGEEERSGMGIGHGAEPGEHRRVDRSPRSP